MLDLLMPMLWTENNGPQQWFGSFGGGGRTRAGVTVNEEIALTYEAVFAATRILAEGVGSVPLPCYERVGDTDRRVVHDQVTDALRYLANPKLPAGAFRESRVAHQVNWGGGFAEIDVTRGQVSLWPIHPSRIRPAEQGSDYDYRVINEDGTPTYLYADEVLHVPGALADDGTWGRGIIRTGKQTIGTGIGTERCVADFFGTGGQPKGILKGQGLGGHDAEAKAKRAAVRADWDKLHGQPETNAPKIAVFGPGVEYTPISLTNEANQLIQTRQINKGNIATLYTIPAYKLGAEGKETAGTIEQKAIEFVVYSLLPWARKFEEQCNFKMLPATLRAKRYFEHNFSALLRGDIMSRYNAYRIAFSIGIMSINEIRRLENLPGIGLAGDQHFVPANMTTAQRALLGDFGNGGAVGSDTTGSPADNPVNHQAAADRQHHEWLASLGHIQRDEIKTQLKELKSALEPRPAEWREAARKTLVDALSRMFTKESRAASALKKSDMPKWIADFYAKHEPLVAEAVGPACCVLGIAGFNRWANPTNLAAWLRARSAEAIERTYNQDSPEVRARKFEMWPTERAAQIADELLSES